MNRPPIITLFFYSLLVAASLARCTGKEANTASGYRPVFSADTTEKNTLIFGFPSFSYSESAEQLLRYLNAHSSGIRFKMKACITYDEYLTLLNQNKFDLTVISGIQAILISDSNYSICGKISNDKKYTGVIFSRKNAEIRNVADLKGKKVALVPVNIIPGTMMPLYYLFKNSLDVNHDIVRVNVSSFESAIIATYLGKSEAGICLKRNWDVYTKTHPEILTKVVLNWETPPLINNALLIKNGIDSSTQSHIKALLFSLHSSTEGRIALDKLGIPGFEKATKDTYKPMMEFKRRYDSLIL